LAQLPETFVAHINNAFLEADNLVLTYSYYNFSNYNELYMAQKSIAKESYFGLITVFKFA
ncbi:MAG: hypothetical protein WC535_07880, partial [Candidatus Cloacimonas sp.]